MMETLTRGEVQVVVGDLKTELQKIRENLKREGALSVISDELKKRETSLQSKINDILKKGGIITEEDYNEAYNLIRSKNQKEMIDLNQKRKTRMLVFGILVIGAVAYLLTKKMIKK